MLLHCVKSRKKTENKTQGSQRQIKKRSFYQNVQCLIIKDQDL